MLLLRVWTIVQDSRDAVAALLQESTFRGIRIMLSLRGVHHRDERDHAWKKRLNQLLKRYNAVLDLDCIRLRNRVVRILA